MGFSSRTRHGSAEVDLIHIAFQSGFSRVQNPRLAKALTVATALFSASSKPSVLARQKAQQRASMNDSII